MRVKVVIFTTVIAGLLVAGPATGSATVRFSPRAPSPASAVILRPSIVARATPSQAGRIVAVFRQFRGDFRPTVVQVLGEHRGAQGLRWLEVAVPGRPNGRRGWVPAPSLQVRPAARMIVVDLSARRLRLVEHGRTRFETRVVIGRRGAETPTGLFYVTAAFVPTERYLGAYAFETSAYSKLSEWPGGGIVGLHGTTAPQLLGKAVSHGCVRMSNAAARVLRRLVDAGTPVRIVG
jgi:lipoprotein-anchoring transpeptidase ErfK/SrfK